MYADPTGYREVTPQGPRSLHFRGMRPIPRLQKLASSSARPGRPLSAILGELDAEYDRADHI